MSSYSRRLSTRWRHSTVAVDATPPMLTRWPPIATPPTIAAKPKLPCWQRSSHWLSWSSCGQWSPSRHWLLIATPLPIALPPSAALAVVCKPMNSDLCVLSLPLLERCLGLQQISVFSLPLLERCLGLQQISDCPAWRRTKETTWGRPAAMVMGDVNGRRPQRAERWRWGRGVAGGRPGGRSKGTWCSAM